MSSASDKRLWFSQWLDSLICPVLLVISNPSRACWQLVQVMVTNAILLVLGGSCAGIVLHSTTPPANAGAPKAVYHLPYGDASQAVAIVPHHDARLAGYQHYRVFG
jgi:hypothetical protein